MNDNKRKTQFQEACKMSDEKWTKAIKDELSFIGFEFVGYITPKSKIPVVEGRASLFKNEWDYTDNTLSVILVKRGDEYFFAGNGHHYAAVQERRTERSYESFWIEGFDIEKMTPIPTLRRYKDKFGLCFYTALIPKNLTYALSTMPTHKYNRNKWRPK